jgi:RNA polymerase sigma factor (sigma-70 family)
MPMQDQETVMGIEAYDRYAVPLYSYCRSLLTEPADAADAVQDTFLIATVKAGGLRHPDRLRSWLYAVARNECYRRLRFGEVTAALEQAADIAAGAVDLGSAVQEAELRQPGHAGRAAHREPWRLHRHRAAEPVAVGG